MVLVSLKSLVKWRTACTETFGNCHGQFLEVFPVGFRVVNLSLTVQAGPSMVWFFYACCRCSMGNFFQMAGLASLEVIFPRFFAQLHSVRMLQPAACVHYAAGLT